MSDKKDAVGDRMKRYEGVPRHSLMTRTPVIVRVDGRAFHTYTRGMERPFDKILQNAMVESAIQVAKEMSGFKLGYTQSDEASFLLTDWDTLETQPWFDYDQQKLASLCASIMTAHFNKIIHDSINSLWQSWAEKGAGNPQPHPFPKALAAFDGRAFNIPIGPEIVNYFLWRAKDWERNSLSMVALSHFSAKQLHGKKKADMHEMLYKKGVNWTKDFDAMSRNGTFIVRTEGPTCVPNGRDKNFMKLSPAPSYSSLSAIVGPIIGIDLTSKVGGGK